MTEERTIYPIDLLDLSTRARNVLVEAGLTTPEDMKRHSDEELLDLYGFGSASLREVKQRLTWWEQEQQPEEPEEPPAAERDPLPLLPGRRVLHAAWLPGELGRLFLWGEGAPLDDGDGAIFHRRRRSRSRTASRPAPSAGSSASIGGRSAGSRCWSPSAIGSAWGAGARTPARGR